MFDKVRELEKIPIISSLQLPRGLRFAYINISINNNNQRYELFIILRTTFSIDGSFHHLSFKVCCFSAFNWVHAVLGKWHNNMYSAIIELVRQFALKCLLVFKLNPLFGHYLLKTIIPEQAAASATQKGTACVRISIGHCSLLKYLRTFTAVNNNLSPLLYSLGRPSDKCPR